jgi:uncharacterized protein (TIGR03437 family)
MRLSRLRPRGEESAWHSATALASFVTGALFLILGPVAASAQAGSIVTHEIPANSSPSAIDAAGNLYSIGSSSGTFDVTPGAAQTTNGGGVCGGFPSPMACSDALIVKADSSGNEIFGTLLGGPTADYGLAIAVDAAGNAYAVGSTGGSFPTTANAAIQASATSTTWAAKISADGSTFLYVTYLPDVIKNVYGVAVDMQGNAYVAGATASSHACVVKISADGSAFLYTSILAGSNQQFAAAVVADSTGNAYVTGSTASPDFPVTPGAVQTSLAGPKNAFLTKLDPSGNIVFSTFLGGSGMDQGSALQVDAAGSAYVAGSATSLDFPTTQGSFQPAPLVPAWAGSPLGFLAKIAPDGSLIEYATYIPASTPRLALGPTGDLYLAALTGPGFPVTSSAPQPCVPGSFDDAGGDVIAHFNPMGALLDATYAPEDSGTALAVMADGSVLLAGDRLSQIRFGGAGWTAGSCMTLTVFNAATQIAAYEMAAGELVTFFGAGIGPNVGAAASPDPTAGYPTSLGGVEVLFDGVPGPVFYAQCGQVNAQAPFELNGQSTTNVTLRYGGSTFGPIPMELRFADPGLFRAQPGVSAQALALNPDGTLNSASNPASRGAVVTLFGNGFGPTVPACATGAASGSSSATPTALIPNLSVILGGNPAQSAGGAPGLACGIIQIQMQIPTTSQIGPLIVNPTAVLNPPGGPMSEVQPSPVDSVIYVK